VVERCLSFLASPKRNYDKEPTTGPRGGVRFFTDISVYATFRILEANAARVNICGVSRRKLQKRTDRYYALKRKKKGLASLGFAKARQRGSGTKRLQTSPVTPTIGESYHRKNDLSHYRIYSPFGDERPNECTRGGKFEELLQN